MRLLFFMWRGVARKNTPPPPPPPPHFPFHLAALKVSHLRPHPATQLVSVVCGKFQSAGWNFGTSRQKGNLDMFHLSLCKAACSAPEKSEGSVFAPIFSMRVGGSLYRLVSPGRKETIKICQQLENGLEMFI